MLQNSARYSACSKQDYVIVGIEIVSCAVSSVVQCIEQRSADYLCHSFNSVEISDVSCAISMSSDQITT